MELNFTGFGSAFNFKDGSNSTYFINDNHLYVIDSGETTYGTLLKKVDFKSFEHVTFIITHLHNDHVGSLGTAISDLYLNMGIVINIVHPLDSIVNFLDLMGVEHKMYNFIKTIQYVNKEIQVDYVKTKHVTNMTCYGLLINDGQSLIYYSGDANSIPKTILDQFLEGKIKTLYQDTCISISGAGGHLYIETLKELIPKTLRENIVCMHLEEDSEKEIEKYGFKVATIK